MLIEFSVENFQSFKDRATLSLVASNGKDEASTYPVRGDMHLLPLAGIFGANASGKSNFVKAIAYVQGALTSPNPFQAPISAHPLLKPFLLNSSSAQKPSVFELALWDQKQHKEYRYSFGVSAHRIEWEQLEIAEKVKSNYVSSLVFERKGNSFKFGAKYRKQLQPIAERVLPTAYAVNVFAILNHEPSLQFIRLIQNILIVDGMQDVTPHSLERLAVDAEFRIRVLELLQNADIGIDDLIVEKNEVSADQMPFQIQSVEGSATKFNLYNFQVLTTHHMQDEPGRRVLFNLQQNESFGTQRLFGYAALLLQVVEQESVLIIDEFGASMHPQVAAAMVRLVKQLQSKHSGAQLVFVTHDTYLLSDKGGLRRDEIWFTEKNNSAESQLVSLVEYRVRNDLNIEKSYREGRFGAVPVTTFD